MEEVYWVSVTVPTPPTPKGLEEQERLRKTTQDFLDELTALSHKYGLYLRCNTEDDYSGGIYGYISIETLVESHKTHSYGYDHDLKFTNWHDGWWEKQAEWNKTIVGKINDTV